MSKNLWTNCCFSLVLNHKSEHHFLQELSVSSVGCFGWWCRSQVLIPHSFLCLFPLFICYLLFFPTCRRTHLAELLVGSLICGQISLCVYVNTYIIIIVICLFVCLFVYPPRQSLGKSQTRNRFYPGKTMRWDLLEKVFKEILYYVFRAEMPEQINFFQYWTQSMCEAGNSHTVFCVHRAWIMTAASVSLMWRSWRGWTTR